MEKKTHISPIGEQPYRFYEFILEKGERDRSLSRSPLGEGATAGLCLPLLLDYIGALKC